MSTTSTRQRSTRLDIPGRVTFMEGNGDLEMIEVNTGWSTAEVYLQGAQVTHFQRKDEPPLLFLSQLSRFEEGVPIRGGVPVVFPWFGPREGGPMHGFARNKTWDLREITQMADGGLCLQLRLPDCAEAALLPRFTADYSITIGRHLALELRIINTSPDQDLVFENCLHGYFAVGDIREASVTGLEGAAYLDKTRNYARMIQDAEPLRVSQETDRIYLGTPAAVQIEDHKLGRRVRIEKTGSQSTVVWNPWGARAQQMPDFGNEEYLQMVCVEPGNVSENKVTLSAGQSASLAVTLSTGPL